MTENTMKRMRKKAVRRPPLELPHERDEHIDPPHRARKVIAQAATDVSAGLVDTDNYTRAAAVAALAPSRKRRAL